MIREAGPREPIGCVSQNDQQGNCYDPQNRPTQPIGYDSQSRTTGANWL
jgi:hypothetical protein